MWFEQWRLRTAVLVMLTVFAFGGTALGQGEQEPSAKITITVIKARKSPPFLDEVLKPIWPTLKKTFGDRFAYYEQFSTTEETLLVNQSTSAQMPGGQPFKAIYGGLSPNKGLLRVHLEFGEYRTKVRIHDGGVFFQAGSKHEKDTIVVAIKAELTEKD